MGSAPSELRLQYSTNSGSSWTDAGPTVTVSSTGLRTGTTTNLVAGAKADALFRIAGANGNGSLDPTFQFASLEFR